MVDNNQIVCERRSYSKEFTSHQHEFGQFLFPLQGSLDIQTKWQEVNLNSDYCFYLPPKLNHQYRSKDRNEFLILDVPTMHLPKSTSSMHIPLDKQWDAIRYLLLEEARKEDNNFSLSYLTKYVTSKLQTANPPSIDYIHRHFKKPINIETLAKVEHYHPVYYSNWFKKQTGKSPKQYIDELRLKEAKTLLLTTDRSITNISEEVSFVNSSSFTRWFNRLEGIAPQNYRKLNNRQKIY